MTNMIEGKTEGETKNANSNSFDRLKQYLKDQSSDATLVHRDNLPSTYYEDVVKTLVWEYVDKHGNKVPVLLCVSTSKTVNEIKLSEYLSTSNLGTL